jgi:hypothetical protein
VREKYLEIGEHQAKRGSFPHLVYFVGKITWGKGFREMFNLLDSYKELHGVGIPIDIFGGGPHFDEIVKVLL